MIEGKQDFSKLFGDKGIEAKSPERTRKGEENFQHQDIYKFRKEKVRFIVLDNLCLCLFDFYYRLGK